MRSAVTLEAELRQVAIAVAQGFEALTLQPLRDDCLSVVGYGPSLEDTWREIKHPLVTVSGAHDFLAARGIVPDWHVECDGRAHKCKHLERPHDETVYVMATICSPAMWTQLKGKRVLRWHNANGQHIVDWIAKNDDGGLLIAGGSVVGLSAIHIGGILGFRKFKLYGFDGNFRDGKRHAGEHFGPRQEVYKRKAGGKWWKTTPQMMNAADELLWLLAQAPELSIEVVGDSMTAAMMAARKP